MINRKHKDRLFSFIFGKEENRKWTLDLYNAINGSHYTEPEEIEITTMEDVLYMGMKNDIAFLLHWMMSIWEHQSSINPNMPVRELMYIGRLYDKFIHQNKLNIYGRELIQLPVPKLVCFYNGTDEEPDDGEAPDAGPGAGGGGWRRSPMIRARSTRFSARTRPCRPARGSRPARASAPGG